MLSVSACLLGEVPEYEPRKQTPPVLITASAEPSFGSVVQVREGDTLEFSVPFRSEDAGESVNVLLFRDYQLVNPNQGFLNSSVLPPESNLFDDNLPPTIARIPHTFGSADRGCHSYTLILAHDSNLQAVTVKSFSRVAMLSWWVDVTESDTSIEPGTTPVSECGLGGS